MVNRQLIGPAAACAGMILFRLLDASLHWGWLTAGAVYVALAEYRFFLHHQPRKNRCFVFLGAGMVLAAAIAKRLAYAGQTGWMGLLLSLLIAMCLAPSAAQTLLWLRQGIMQFRKPLGLQGSRAFLISITVILLCWLPLMLALFPGVTGYDMQSQIQQVSTGEYVNGHPIAHTLLIGLFYRMGDGLFHNPSLGIGLFTCFQVLCLAGSIAYAMYWLSLRHIPRMIWWAILTVFALAPQHAVMANSLTKDVLFAAALLMVTVELNRWLLEPERAAKRKIIALDILLLIVAGLLRRNMVLAYIVLALVLLFRARKKDWGRRLLALVLSGMILSLGCETLLKKSVNAQDPTIHDTLAMPCQQLARVYHLYGLDHPVGYEIEEKLPWAYAYSPERADAAKRGAKLVGSGRLVSFLKLWARESVHYPIEYIDAFLYTNKAYWDIGDTAYAYTYDDEKYGPRGVMTVNHNPHSQIEQYDWLPAIQKLCDEWYTNNKCMNILPVRILVHPALWTWMLLFGLTWVIHERGKKTAIAWLLPAAYLCTLMLGPCALVRYCYCIMLTAPILIGFACTLSKEESLCVRNKE